MQTYTPTSFLHRFSGLRPRFVVIVSLVLIVALFITGMLELRQAKQEIHFLMEEEATTLWASITKSATNAIFAFDEIEQLVTDRLLTVARLVARLDQESRLTTASLAEIADANKVYRINIYSANRQRICSNVSVTSDSMHQEIPHHTAFTEIMNGTINEAILGLIDSRHPDEQRFAVAVKRPGGGAIVVNINARALLDFRKSIGVGRLLQDIGDFKNIAYIVLQDSSGILLASNGVIRMGNLSNDRFLESAFREQRQDSRYTKYDDINVFEFVGPFIVDDDNLGLLRIGLTTTHLVEANARIKRRLFIMLVVMGFLMLVVINFLTVNQNYQVINDAYRRIRSYSTDILQRMTDAVIAVDTHGMVTMLNSAAQQLFHSLQLQPQLSAPAQLHDLLPHLFQTLTDGKPIFHAEHVMVLNDRRHILEISTSVISDTNGNVESAFAVINDLSERRRLEESLQRNDKLVAMGQLASGVAHEIRNPLNSIGMISQRLNKEFSPTTESDEYNQLTTSMVKEVRRINDIILQFLKFAKPPKLQTTTLDLSEIVREVMFLMKSQADQQHIRLHDELMQLPPYPFDINLMKQALLNLMQNSLDAIDENGDIWLRTRHSANGLTLHVDDNGKGIDAATLPKIFNLYFTTKPTGTGLGLSMVHQIISQHKGRIDVTSAPGNGTQFTISFPGV
jgi:two-component system, NtrC family, sensor histidine kinase HydH